MYNGQLVTSITVGAIAAIITFFTMMNGDDPSFWSSLFLSAGVGVGALMGVNTLFIRAGGPPDQLYDNKQSLQYKQARDVNRIANKLDGR